MKYRVKSVVLCLILVLALPLSSEVVPAANIIGAGENETEPDYLIGDEDIETPEIDIDDPDSSQDLFSDVTDSKHPYFKAIYWARSKGITKGYSDGTFGINRNCTRGEAVMFLWRAKGQPAPKISSVSPFRDVQTNHAFYKAILWAFQNGITKGYTSGANKGKFGINDTCTRGQIMTFVWRALGQKAPTMTPTSPFKDVPTNHAYYKAILWGFQQGITKGYTSGANKGNFGINDNCTRGQIVTFLYRALA